MVKYKRQSLIWSLRLLLLLNVFILVVLSMIKISETITDKFTWEGLILVPICIGFIILCIKVLYSKKATIIPKNEITDTTVCVDENEGGSMWTPWNGFEKW